ncbi:hypothetical protein evm_000745 [Chilo suppressalis]|nr:hypothetical protein evm_000745 [Chilo suppressalis]
MLLVYTWSVLCVLSLHFLDCDGQFVKLRGNPRSSPVPFPACRADNIDCLRRGIRTFFVLMDQGHVGMETVDPYIVNSVALSLPEDKMSILLRRANVTGARWTKLTDRRFNLNGGKTSTTFSSELHVTGELNLNMAARVDPFVAHLTMDIHEVETNITYPWRGIKGIDNEDYILIGSERIAVRNTRTPSYFLQPNTEDTFTIDTILQQKQSVLDHLANEITTALMHTVVDNFRLFASKVPVRRTATINTPSLTTTTTCNNTIQELLKKFSYELFTLRKVLKQNLIKNVMYCLDHASHLLLQCKGPYSLSILLDPACGTALYT